MLKCLILTSAVLSFVGCTAFPETTDHKTKYQWVLVDDFESNSPLETWTNIDVQNETKPFVLNPQITEIRAEPSTNNHYLLKKPAGEGVLGNRKAISFMQLPNQIGVGESYTIYTRIKVEYFPNNHSFGLSNVAASEISEWHYDSFEPMIRITDKVESNGYKNDGALMVSNGYKAYRMIINPGTGEAAAPLVPGTWYELWYVVNNAPRDKGGQKYDLFVRGGEFPTQQLVATGAVFRMQRELPLKIFMAICNTGSHEMPYGNGGVGYDDIYMAQGHILTSPKGDRI